MSDININFDISTAISGLYLWLLFGYLSSMVSCDLQKMMQNNMIMRHSIGIIAFFFLFTVVDKDNKSPIISLWGKTIYVYLLFLLLVKSKWYFSLPVLLCLVIDQTLKSHIDYLTNIDTNDKNIEKYKNYRNKLFTVMLLLIVGGFVHYTFRQYNEFGKDFNFVTLLLSHSCKNE